MSKSIHLCQSYSKPKVGRFLKTRCINCKHAQWSAEAKSLRYKKKSANEIGCLLEIVGLEMTTKGIRAVHTQSWRERVPDFRSYSAEAMDANWSLIVLLVLYVNEEDTLACLKWSISVSGIQADRCGNEFILSSLVSVSISSWVLKTRDGK